MEMSSSCLRQQEKEKMSKETVFPTDPYVWKIVFSETRMKVCLIKYIFCRKVL